MCNIICMHIKLEILIFFKGVSQRSNISTRAASSSTKRSTSARPDSIVVEPPLSQAEVSDGKEMMQTNGDKEEVDEKEGHSG